MRVFRIFVLHHLLLLIFAMLLFWPLCFGRTLYWGDILLYFAPMLRFQQEALHLGHIPLWNPNVLCGQPFIGNPQLGIFYPCTVLLTFLPVWLYLNIMIIGHVFLGGAAMTAYLKRWVHDPFAALIGGLVFMGSEYIVGRAQFPPMIFTAVYFPLVLRGIDSCLDNRGGKASSSLRSTCVAHASLALIIGLMVLAAHPQMAYLILLFSGMYLFARLKQQACVLVSPALRGKVLIGSQRFLSISAAIILGLLASSVQTLPALQLLLESPRQHLSSAQANRFVLEPTHLLTLLWPRYWGHPATANYWGGGAAWEPSFFVGWIPLFLIGIALRSAWKSGWKHKRIWFWAAGCLLGIWLALGSAGGLYWIAFTFLPGLSNFHDPARFLLYTVFSLATLAAFGWDAALERVEALPDRIRINYYKIGIDRRWIYKTSARPVCFFAISLPLLFYANDWNPTTYNDVLSRKPTYLPSILASAYADAGSSSITTSNINLADRRSTVSKGGTRQHLNPVNQGRISLAAQENIWKHFITEGYTDYGTIRADAIHNFLDTMLPNIGMNDGLLLSSGYEPIPVYAPSVLNDSANNSLQRSEPNLTRLLALLDIRSLLFFKPFRVFDPGLRAFPLTGAGSYATKTAKHAEVPPPSLSAWENRSWQHTAWVVSRTHHIEGTMRVNAALTAPDFNPFTIALLCDAAQAQEPDLEWGNTLDSSSIKPVISNSLSDFHPEVYRRGTDEVQITVYNDKPDALLVISMTAYPGWQATDQILGDNKQDISNNHSVNINLTDNSIRNAVIHRVDGALMGIYLNKGQHRIVLKYVPDCYHIGLYLSLTASSLICFGLGMYLPSKL